MTWTELSFADYELESWPYRHLVSADGRAEVADVVARLPRPLPRVLLLANLMNPGISCMECTPAELQAFGWYMPGLVRALASYSPAEEVPILYFMGSFIRLFAVSLDGLGSHSTGGVRELLPTYRANRRGVFSVLEDITDLRTDAIVNAANADMKRGGGVCGAIYRRAGPALEALTSKGGGCPVGGARMTPGFGLHSRHIIHAVGPIWKGGASGEAALLASAYSKAVTLAEENGCRSVTFPALSTGVFGYPADEAVRIAAASVREAMRLCPTVAEVLFACVDEKMLDTFRAVGVERG